MNDPSFAGFRVPPQDLEAEQSVLGAMFLNREAIRIVIQKLSPEDFYRGAHRNIYKAILAVDDRKEPVDAITLSNELRRMEEFDTVGGLAGIQALADRVPTAANIEFYAEIVKEKSASRRLITAATQVVAEAYEDTTPIKELLDSAEKRIFDATYYRTVSGSITVKERAGKICELLLTRGPEHGITGVATGFDYIDEMTGGFQNSELVIIGARPSVGKTALALSMALNAAGGTTKTFKKTPVGLFSLEMTADQILTRAFCMLGDVDSRKARSGFFEENEHHKLIQAAEKIHAMDIRLNDTSQMNIFEIKAEARRWREKGIGILFVDYLTLISPGFRADRREQEVAFISGQLKALARDLQIPVVALSQLSRPMKGQEDREPHLSDLRESGAIEQDADTVIFIHKKLNDDGETYNYSLLLSKQRNGPTGRSFITFKPKSTKFENYRPEKTEQVGQEEQEQAETHESSWRPNR